MSEGQVAALLLWLVLLAFSLNASPAAHPLAPTCISIFASAAPSSWYRCGPRAGLHEAGDPLFLGLTSLTPASWLAPALLAPASHPCCSSGPWCHPP